VEPIGETIFQNMIQAPNLAQILQIPIGALITDDAERIGDIRARLGNGTGNLKSTQILWQSHDISVDIKVRLLKTVVLSATMYGCESWTLRKSHESRIEAFEMKGLRQILRVARIARKTNEWILEKAGVTRTLLVCITKLHYFGHIIRHLLKSISPKEPWQERGKEEDQRQHTPCPKISDTPTDKLI